MGQTHYLTKSWVFRTKCAQFFTKWFVLFHFSLPYLFTQPPLQSQSFPLLQPIFTSILVHKKNPYNPLRHSVPLYFSHSMPPYFHRQPSLQSPSNIISPTLNIHLIQAASKAQQVSLVWNDTVSTSNADVCQNDKQSTQPSPTPSKYYHYFHSPLIPSQDLKCPRKSVASQQQFSSHV